MRTRTLTAAAIALITLGAAAAAAGLYPAAPTLLVRAGIVLIVLSVPPTVAAQTRRAATVAQERLDAATVAGYRLGLEHAARGILTPDPDGSAAPTSYARGYLRAVTSDTERKAE